MKKIHTAWLFLSCVIRRGPADQFSSEAAPNEYYILHFTFVFAAEET